MPSRSRLQPLARAVLRTQTDDRLVALARDGKEAAFEEIVRRYRSGLVAFAAAYGPPDPEDVVQESLMRSWDALRVSTGEMHLKAWLHTIVRNRALNARRDFREHEPIFDQIDGVRGPAEIVLTSEELDRTIAVVANLPDAQREALVRSALDGRTHEQIAASIGSTPGAVRQLIYRARLTVRHGVGAVIPLPLVAALAELGAGGAGGAAAGGAAAAGAAGGASLAAKAAVVAAIGAVAIGSGVAVKRSHDSNEHRTQAKVARGSTPAITEAATPATPAMPTPGTTDDSGQGSEGDIRGAGDDGPSGEGSGGQGSDSSGSGPGTSPGDDSGDSGPQHGEGATSSGSGSSGSSSGGSGSGHSGPSHSGSSGPGPGPDAADVDADPVNQDSSGPEGGADTNVAVDDGSGGSGHGGDSSGSGSSEVEAPADD